MTCAQKPTAAEAFVARRAKRAELAAARRRQTELRRKRDDMRRLRFVRRWAAALAVLGDNLRTAGALARHDGAVGR